MRLCGGSFPRSETPTPRALAHYSFQFFLATRACDWDPKRPPPWEQAASMTVADAIVLVQKGRVTENVFARSIALCGLVACMISLASFPFDDAAVAILMVAVAVFVATVGCKWIFYAPLERRAMKLLADNLDGLCVAKKDDGITQLMLIAELPDHFHAAHPLVVGVFRLASMHPHIVASASKHADCHGRTALDRAMSDLANSPARAFLFHRMVTADAEPFTSMDVEAFRGEYKPRVGTILDPGSIFI